jgi:hypothetical protein
VATTPLAQFSRSGLMVARSHRRLTTKGIESGGDSASVVLYYYQGKWLTLQGAD